VNIKTCFIKTLQLHHFKSLGTINYQEKFGFFKCSGQTGLVQGLTWLVWLKDIYHQSPCVGISMSYSGASESNLWAKLYLVVKILLFPLFPCGVCLPPSSSFWGTTFALQVFCGAL